ncbi:DNA polymerase Y family protein [Methylocapsa sp. D3K7]|uniref:Y-family DNA polymerase n=1 Tax=Methylocapsa sp. D3K7 TaxID=3041435 RepID=UPI00244EAD9C|nr:DNA polymerase Y family protein [Methylocapsa sp. D3K7]WGJ14965.1 DNA polymerase Y family protein [Methylocapsa sp. D3K7]
MPRVVSLFLPSWPTDRLRRTLGAAAPPPEAPLVLAGRDGRRRLVLALDAAARRMGLHAGMPAAKAQALVPGLSMRDADPAADAKALDRLALWALQRYAPIAAADPPDGLIIDVTGAAHLHGGEDALLKGLVARLAASGIAARTAIADSWGAAHAFARTGTRPVLVIPVGESVKAILDLPIAALRLPKTIVEDLSILGFARIGELAAKPRAPLALRFGPELGRRLDQAMGRLSEPIDPVRPPDLIEVRRVFAEPIGAPETLARYTDKLVTQLCEILEAKGLGVRRLDLLFHRVDNRIEAIRVGTVRPVCDTKRLTRLLGDKIETIDPGFGIEMMRLAAPLAEPLAPKQLLSSLSEEPEADVSSLIDSFANRIGERHLYRFAPVASDVPERSVQKIAPVAQDTGETWPDSWPRPARLFPRPEPIETLALLPDHPPISFTWRGIRRRVTCADGPERIFGEWWKQDAELFAVRDYFQVEDEAGERFWIYRAGDGEDAARFETRRCRAAARRDALRAGQRGEDTTTGSQRWFLHGIFG